MIEITTAITATTLVSGTVAAEQVAEDPDGERLSPARS
jgi:hypothetical protein